MRRNRTETRHWRHHYKDAVMRHNADEEEPNFNPPTDHVVRPYVVVAMLVGIAVALMIQVISSM